MADASAFAKLVPGFDFLEGLVKNAGAAMPGIGQWVAPTLNPEELDQRIQELRTVQYWLEQNARMLGATIQADIIKQKAPTLNGGYAAVDKVAGPFGKFDERMYSELCSEHPIDMTRYQVANCYMGRAGLINSGGASSGAGDLAEAVKTAIINKRASN